MLDHQADPTTIAREALERAHVAARNANGSELRRSLHSAAEALAVPNPEAARKLNQALEKLDTGALAEVDSLLENVRRELASADTI